MMKIIRPALLLDEKKCRENIRLMTKKAKDSRVVFRPHFKTHQSAEIGEWFRQEGTDKITVSSVTMAQYFADAGWHDILIAFPVNILEIGNINELAQKINLSLLVESGETLQFLNTNLTRKTDIYIKIDTGYKRTGVPWNNPELTGTLIEIMKLAHVLNFKGFVTHSGHAYQASGPAEINRIYQDTVSKLLQVKKRFTSKNFSPLISVGDTPTCSIAGDFNQVDEIRPGNFVFYDMMQYQLGSCLIDNIAVALACPVVAKNLKRNELLVYGGAIHLSKEFMANPQGIISYGSVVKLLRDGWSEPLPETYVKSISQEHGIIKSTDKIVSGTGIGEMIGILPVHSCLTANQMKTYLTLDEKLIKMMQNYQPV